MQLVLVVALAISAAASMSGQASPPSARETAEALQLKYDTIRDFSADFVHTYEGGVLRRKTSERGTLLVKKPAMMRWEYQAPEKKSFVSDGVKMYSYLPADRQVIVGTLPAEDQATTPILFLAGKGRLTRDFTASYADRAGMPDTYALRLDPIRPEREYDFLTLVISRETRQIRQLVATDRQGGTSTFTFTNLKENIGLSDKTFRFTIPRGVDVITNGQPRR